MSVMVVTAFRALTQPRERGWVRAPTGGHDTNWGGLPNHDGFGQQMGKPVAPWGGRTTGILPFAAQQRPELVSGLTDRPPVPASRRATRMRTSAIFSVSICSRLVNVTRSRRSDDGRWVLR